MFKRAAAGHKKITNESRETAQDYSNQRMFATPKANLRRGLRSADLSDRCKAMTAKMQTLNGTNKTLQFQYGSVLIGQEGKGDVITISFKKKAPTLFG